jgi:hypothetical protein
LKPIFAVDGAGRDEEDFVLRYDGARFVGVWLVFHKDEER